MKPDENKFGGSSEEKIPFFMVTLPNKTMSIKLNRALDSDDRELAHTFAETLGLLNQLVKIFYICNDAHDYLIFSINRLENTVESHTHVARAIIDFLSDSRLIINYLENWTKSNLSSEYYQKWLEFEHGMFDRFVSYRIGYHLRNIAQHKIFIIGKINEYIVDNGKLKKDIYLNKSVLDNNFYNKTKTSANFFENDRNLSIMPHLENYFLGIQYLYLDAGRKFFDENKEKINQMIELCESKGYSSWIYHGVTNSKKINENNWDVDASEIITVPKIVDVLKILNEEKIANINFNIKGIS